jgi:hypothetical protein
MRLVTELVPLGKEYKEVTTPADVSSKIVGLPALTPPEAVPP